MSAHEPTATYLELRESTADGEAAAGLSHSAEGLVLLHVQEIAADGEPRGAVTIVHDAGGHGGRYVELASELAGNGLAVALPDLRGHGRSEGPRGHSNGLKEVLRDLGDVQDHLAYRLPEAPKVLVGHGLGALYALAFACEREGDLAALVLVAPLLEPRFAKPEAKGGLFKMFKKTGPDTPGSIGWSASELTRATPPADELTHDVITLRAIEEAEAAAARYRSRLAELSIPVLVVHGTADPIASSQTAQAAAGQATFEAIEGGLHDLLHDEGASGVVTSITRWIDERLA